MRGQRSFAYLAIDIDFMQSLFLNYYTDKSDTFSSRAKDIDQMCICFCEDNRSIVPLLQLQFSFSVEQNKSFNFNIFLSSVDFFNEITFAFAGCHDGSTKDFSFTFDTPVNLNLSHRMIQKPMNFQATIDN